MLSTIRVKNEKFVRKSSSRFKEIQYLNSYPICSGSISPGLAADMHFKQDVIAFIGPACAFALEPVARLAAYWNTPIITGMGDQVNFHEKSLEKHEQRQNLNDFKASSSFSSSSWNIFITNKCDFNYKSLCTAMQNSKTFL